MYIKINRPKQIQFKWMPSIYQMVFGPKNEVHYIGGTEVLPPPLEAEEEAACISCLGERGQDQAKNTIFVWWFILPRNLIIRESAWRI